jgi:hypothetical protein
MLAKLKNVFCTCLFILRYVKMLGLNILEVLFCLIFILITTFDVNAQPSFRSFSRMNHHTDADTYSRYLKMTFR